jgi:hypothetical protein
LTPPPNGVDPNPKEPPKKGNKKNRTESEIVEWNRVCGTTLGKVLHVGASRQRHLDARRKDPFWDEYYSEALQRILNSDFLTGHNDRGWKASFDWIIERSDALAKIMEGKYDSRSGRKPTTSVARNAEGVPLSIVNAAMAW